MFSKKIFGLSLIIFGISTFFSKNHSAISFGICIIYFGLLVSSVKGIEIDTETNKIREFISIYGIKLGSWKIAKKPEYVSVFTAMYYDDEGSKNEILNVNLFLENKHHITVYQTGDMELAFEIANFFKEVLNINVLDATKNESKWI